MSEVIPRRVRAELTRTSLITAAAAIVREEGPQAVTYRKVAQWANSSPSAVTYYFDNLMELLHQAGKYNISLWAGRAENAADEVESSPPTSNLETIVDALLQACLPHDHNRLQNHYRQLVAASEFDSVSGQYRDGRERLDAAVQRILDHFQVKISPANIIATIDGAAVAALSEGRDVYDSAKELLKELLLVAKPCQQ